MGAEDGSCWKLLWKSCVVASGGATYSSSSGVMVLVVEEEFEEGFGTSAAVPQNILIRFN